MPSRTRRAQTRALGGGAFLFAIYVGLASAWLPGWSGESGAANGGVTTSVIPSANTVALGARTEDGNAIHGAPGPQRAAPSSTAKAAPVTPIDPSLNPTARTPESAPRGAPDLNRVYRVPILIYHRIVPPSEAGTGLPDLVVAPATFAAQMKALFEAGWRSITVAALVSYMEADRTVPPRTFVITIDDGWSDGYEYAFPIMRKYGFVATFFVISSRIDQKDFLSSFQLRALDAAGDEIGNHTEHHVKLSTVTLSRIKAEVQDASSQIGKVIGHRPVSLAYPMGGVNTAVIWVVSQTPDLKIAVTTRYGKAETWFERYDMPRLDVHPNTDPARLVASLGAWRPTFGTSHDVDAPGRRGGGWLIGARRGEPARPSPGLELDGSNPMMRKRPGPEPLSARLRVSRVDHLRRLRSHHIPTTTTTMTIAMVRLT